MVDQAYNDETQRAAIPHVRDGQNAVDQSRTHTSALSDAQKHDVWGDESGPAAVRSSSVKLFTGVADVLAKENALIARFIVENEHAMEAAKQAEWDAEYSFAQVAAALKSVSRSDEARALTEELQKDKYKIETDQRQATTAQMEISSEMDQSSIGATDRDYSKDYNNGAPSGNQTQKPS